MKFFFSNGCFPVWIILFLVSLCKNHCNGQDTVRPNIILIMADDLGYETLGCNGGTSYQTPNLNRLASSGIRFERAYAMPLCTPSRVQLMTGQYNFRNYVRFEYLDTKEKTFANYLKDGGYKTCIAGKWQLGGDTNSPGHFGFDRYCLWQLDQKGYFTRYKDPIITQDSERMVLSENEYGEDVFVNYIKKFMAEQKDHPFFVYYPMVLPHAPFQPEPNHPDYETAVKDVDDVQYFKPMVNYLDAKIGELVSHLEQLEIRNNTLIIFIGDNGTDRRIVSMFQGREVKGDKGFTTEAGTHVPLIASWPGKIKPGEVNKDLVDFTDFLPTLLEASNVPKPERTILDGVSFYGTLLGRSAKKRDWIFCDYDAKGRDFPKRRYAQDKRFKLYDDGEFYDVTVDPEEKNSKPIESLSKQEKNARKRLSDVLAKYQR